jgi:hypothetical protein
MFLDAWFAAAEVVRAQQPCTVVADPLADSFIGDINGIQFCQFVLINLSCCVLWIRSLEDLEQLEQLTEQLRTMDDDTRAPDYRHQSATAAL